MDDRRELLKQTQTNQEAEVEATDEPSAAATGTPAGGSAAVEETAADVADLCQKLREEKDAVYDRLLRKQAELENFRKRMQREKEDFLQHATADLVRALLPTLDGFERALGSAGADHSRVPEQFLQGIELIFRELVEVLGRAGLTRIETVGKIFDPHVHQAVETVEAKGHRDQEVVEELQRGYKLKHRLLRPAIVKVAVAPKKQAASSSENTAAGESE